MRPSLKTMRGSSPRGRGKLLHLIAARLLIRLIPARAGKTARPPAPSFACPAHPRAGRENVNAWQIASHTGGSSPRGRGKPTGTPLRPIGRRLIPARAGKTAAGGQDARRSRAHPRAGGENGPLPADGMELDGSSPRGRGKRRRPQFQHPPPRLIPARAGKTAQLNAYP